MSKFLFFYTIFMALGKTILVQRDNFYLATEGLGRLEQGDERVEKGGYMDTIPDDLRIRRDQFEEVLNGGEEGIFFGPGEKEENDTDLDAEIKEVIDLPDEKVDWYIQEKGLDTEVNDDYMVRRHPEKKATSFDEDETGIPVEEPEREEEPVQAPGEQREPVELAEGEGDDGESQDDRSSCQKGYDNADKKYLQDRDLDGLISTLSKLKEMYWPKKNNKE